MRGYALSVAILQGLRGAASKELSASETLLFRSFTKVFTLLQVRKITSLTLHIPLSPRLGAATLFKLAEESGL